MEGSFNRHLGSKLRLRRLALGLTQTKVAQAINVTFQQIQKYEKGTNGISSLRIMQLANFLKVPVVYFYEDFVACRFSCSVSLMKGEYPIARSIDSRISCVLFASTSAYYSPLCLPSIGLVRRSVGNLHSMSPTSRLCFHGSFCIDSYAAI